MLDGTGRKKNVPDRQAIADRQQGLQERLLEIISQTPDLSGRRHFDAERRIGAVETHERELRRLHSDVIEIEKRSVKFGTGCP